MARAGIPDWRDAASYAPLAQADRSAFAWEWLRRRQDYRDAAAAAFDIGSAKFRAAAWGLHAFEDPALGVPFARPMWTSAAYAWVLSARAHAATLDEDALDLPDLQPFVTQVPEPCGSRLLLSDGLRSLRLDLAGESFSSDRLILEFTLRGLRRLDRPLLLIQRLRSLARTRRFTRAYYPPLRSAHRFIQLLRGFDALEEGASHADLAGTLLDARLDRRRWRDHSPSVRSMAQRLATTGRKMAAGGFRSLLR